MYTCNPLRCTPTSSRILRRWARHIGERGNRLSITAQNAFPAKIHFAQLSCSPVNAVAILLAMVNIWDNLSRIFRDKGEQITLLTRELGYGIIRAIQKKGIRPAYGMVVKNRIIYA